ncbi:MAG: hypothetical protein ACXWKM_11190, partial [Phenylobacterium sp.]
STARSYIQSAYNKTTSVTVTNATIDRATITATIDAQASAPTTFAALVGVSTIPVTAHSVAKGMLLEIAMVLDTSYSMTEVAGSTTKISALKTASGQFLDAMFGTQTTSTRVSVAVVPFSAAVRVVPQGSTPSSTYMDTTGIAPYAYEDLDSTSKTKFTLFTKLKNQSWGGCVMTRPAPYDTDDTTPTTSTPATMFVPWFAPDEPDTNLPVGQTDYINNYISDTGGTCSGSTSGKTDAWRQERTCKYSNATASSSSVGPNFYCDAQAITPLTSTRSTLNTAISGLTPAGTTNILEGMMWGWRVLSPGAPFTEGKSYTSPNNRKVIVLMTDGENNFGGANNPNMSTFFSYGFAKWGHIGQVTSDNPTLVTLMNTKTLQACTNAKAKGILIYTIGFGSGVTAGSASLLQNCASDPTYYYAPKTAADLAPVFQKIAQSINSLRIAE